MCQIKSITKLRSRHRLKVCAVLSNCYEDTRTGLLGVSRKVHLFSFYKGKIMDDLLFVEYSEFNARYNHRDVTARKNEGFRRF